MKIVRAIQTCQACPSQWDAWDEDGNYWYLRFRHGRGTASRSQGDTKDAEYYFQTSHPLDGYISLRAFARLAGFEIEFEQK